MDTKCHGGSEWNAGHWTELGDLNAYECVRSSGDIDVRVDVGSCSGYGTATTASIGTGPIGAVHSLVAGKAGSSVSL